MERSRYRREFVERVGTVAVLGAAASDGVHAASTETEAPVSATPTPSPETPELPDAIESEWPVPDHDPGRSNYAAGAPGPTEQIVELGNRRADASLSGPVLANETLYVGGDDGIVRAYDARTGAEQWQTPVGDTAGTPHVADDTVVVPADGHLVGLADSGDEERWRVETPDREALLVASHGVYYARAGAESASLRCLDPADGSEQWTTDLSGPWISRIVAGGDRVYVPTDGTSPVPWVFDRETGAFLGEDEPTSAGADLPSVDTYADGVVYSADEFFGTLKAEGVGDDETFWTAGPNTDGSFELTGGSDVLFCVSTRGERAGLYAFDDASGEQLWYDDRAVDGAVAADEVVVVPTEDGLLGLDPADGTELWHRPGDVGSGFVLADDMLFATDGDALRAFRAVEGAPTDGSEPAGADLDDDGLYEDVNGNGEADFGDVTALFDGMENPQVAQNPAAYDFNENGELDFGDVVALFERQ